MPLLPQTRFQPPGCPMLARRRRRRGDGGALDVGVMALLDAGVSIVCALPVACRRGDAVAVVVGRNDAMSATAGDGGAAALTNRLIKIGRLTVNRVLDFHDNYRAISSAPIKHAVPESAKASAATYGGLHMIKHSTDGLLFFEGGRELRIEAYDVSQTNALVHADGLGLLPIHFYITFDDFLTVGRCRLAWRYRDDIGVVFERWLDIRQRIAVDQAGAGDCGDHRHR
jgi:hypothetical protein